MEIHQHDIELRVFSYPLTFIHEFQTGNYYISQSPVLNLAPLPLPF